MRLAGTGGRTRAGGGLTQAGAGHAVPMEDLRISPGPGRPRGLAVPASELAESFSHSGGPGGQGVNASDSRVQLSPDVAPAPPSGPSCCASGGRAAPAQLWRSGRWRRRR